MEPARRADPSLAREQQVRSAKLSKFPLAGSLGYPYLAFDDAVPRESAKTDPMGFATNLPERVIPDDVQRLPGFLAGLKMEADRRGALELEDTGDTAAILGSLPLGHAYAAFFVSGMCRAFLHFRKARKGRDKMKFHDREAPKTILETEGRFQLTGHEVLESHLFGAEAAEEKSLCGRGATWGHGGRIECAD